MGKPRCLKHKDPRAWFTTNLENESILYGYMPVDGVSVALD